MQIHPLSIIRAVAGASSGAPAATSAPIQDTDNMFMKLLTAQLKNQSPLSPVDPMQFTSQLVQFNMLDQLAQIRNLLQQAAAPTSAAPASTRSTIPGGN